VHDFCILFLHGGMDGIGNITHTFFMAPLHYCSLKIITKTNKKIFSCISRTTFCFILAGYIRIFYLNIMVVFVFFSSLQTNQYTTEKNISYFFLALFFPVLLSLFQMLPTLKLFCLFIARNYSLRFNIYLSLVVQWLLFLFLIFWQSREQETIGFAGTYIERVSYFGFIPLFLLLLHYFLSINVKRREFLHCFSVTFLLSLDLLVTKYFFRIPIPTLFDSCSTRILGYFNFAGVFCSIWI